MAIAHQFEYVKPGSLREAVKTLARYGSRAQVLAGRTDVVSLIAEAESSLLGLTLGFSSRARLHNHLVLVKYARD